MSKQHFVIVCIINDGFADEAMDAARAVGASSKRTQKTRL